jgi:hypothetical protein
LQRHREWAVAEATASTFKDWVAERDQERSEYRPLSRKLAPALTGAGGVLTLMGALGTWLREARASSEVEPMTDVGAVMGYAEPAGWALAVLGVVLMAATATWFMGGWLPKLIPVLGSVIVALFVSWRLYLLDAAAAGLVREAEERLGFAGYHAGFGWGAWLLLLAVVLLVLGAVAGVLREIDLNKGMSV